MENVQLGAVVGGWAYYIDIAKPGDVHDIYRINNAQGDTKKISTGVFYGVIQDKLYYFDDLEVLCCCNLDGSDKVPIT